VNDVRFGSMGVDVSVSTAAHLGEVRALFDERERRFSRFLPSSELNHVNAAPRGLMLLSEDFASMLSLALDAARATDGLVTPAVGGAIVAAGYDRDFDALSRDHPTGCEEVAVKPARVPSLDSLSILGRFLLRSDDVVLDLNGVVKGKTVDDALALLGRGWISAGGDLATTRPVVVGLPGGESITLERGGLATSSVAVRAWSGGHHLIDPATGAPSTAPWRDVTVAAVSCVAADVAAKAALLLGHAGPSWLDGRGLAGRFVDRDGAVTVNQAWQNAVPVAHAA
jgi:thiamine biosynthesis lipoprotein